MTFRGVLLSAPIAPENLLPPAHPPSAYAPRHLSRIPCARVRPRLLSSRSLLHCPGRADFCVEARECTCFTATAPFQKNAVIAVGVIVRQQKRWPGNAATVTAADGCIRRRRTSRIVLLMKQMRSCTYGPRKQNKEILYVSLRVAARTEVLMMRRSARGLAPFQETGASNDAWLHRWAPYFWAQLGSDSPPPTP